MQCVACVTFSGARAPSSVVSWPHSAQGLGHTLPVAEASPGWAAWELFLYKPQNEFQVIPRVWSSSQKTKVTAARLGVPTPLHRHREEQAEGRGSVPLVRGCLSGHLHAASGRLLSSSSFQGSPSLVDVELGGRDFYRPLSKMSLVVAFGGRSNFPGLECQQVD